MRSNQIFQEPNVDLLKSRQTDKEKDYTLATLSMAVIISAIWKCSVLIINWRWLIKVSDYFSGKGQKVRCSGLSACEGAALSYSDKWQVILDPGS